MPSFTPKPFVIALSLAMLSAAAFAQAPAPIVHRYAPNQPAALPPIALTSPAPGIWVRSAPGAEVKTVSTSADSIELSVTKGLANITLRQPKENEQILVDLPGGQVALFKDGVYTFNAATSTFRVLQGEAAAFPAADANAKPLTVKEDHAVVFGAGSAGNLRAIEFAPFQARADILPAGPDGRMREGYYGNGYYSRDYAYGPYGYWGPYGDGFYSSPYYAWGYPYGAFGWEYPYGFGLGFGYGFGYGFGGGRLGFRR